MQIIIGAAAWTPSHASAIHIIAELLRSVSLNAPGTFAWLESVPHRIAASATFEWNFPRRWHAILSGGEEGGAGGGEGGGVGQQFCQHGCRSGTAAKPSRHSPGHWVRM